MSDAYLGKRKQNDSCISGELKPSKLSSFSMVVVNTTDVIPLLTTMSVAMAEWRCLYFRSLTPREVKKQKKRFTVYD